MIHRHASLVIAALTLLVACARPASDAQTVPAPREIAGFSHPESVLIVGDRRFVSNLGATLNAGAHDGDGFISELDASGAIVKLRAFTGLDAPKGMAMLGQTLYVADIDKVVGIDVATGARAFEARAPNANAFLNDLAVEGTNTLLVTDSAAGQVDRVSIADRSITPVSDPIPGANGIDVSEDLADAIVVGMGTDFTGAGLYDVTLSDGTVRQLGDAKGIFDGVAILPGGDVLVSDWVAIDGGKPGAVRVYHPDGMLARDLALPTQVKGPADLAYDEDRHEIWLPRMIDGAVSIIPLQ